jgi:hypothetical protein
VLQQIQGTNMDATGGLLRMATDEAARAEAVRNTVTSCTDSAWASRWNPPPLSHLGPERSVSVTLFILSSHPQPAAPHRL